MLIFGIFGVVNFVYGVFFMIGVFCVVIFSWILILLYIVIDEICMDFFGNLLKVEVFYVYDIFGVVMGDVIIDWVVFLFIFFVILVMIGIGIIMECGFIKYFYKCLYVDQIFVIFGFVIVLQEIIKYYFGVNLILIFVFDVFKGFFDFG